MSLNLFVSHPELANFDYASCVFVHGSIPTIPTIPLRLDGRLADLESAVSTPGGPFDQLKARFKDMEDRQIGKAVTMGGFTFRDASAVEALISVLGDDEIYRFAFDMKAQIVACTDDFVTTRESLASKAAAIKAGFHSWKAARMSATFDIKFPETMIKKSNKSEDAMH